MGVFLMNSQVRRYYRKFNEDETPIRPFHDVIPLHETAGITWPEAHKLAEDLPKGWFELARLPSVDRVAFIQEFWLETLPYVPHIHDFLETFFSKLDDIGAYLLQDRFDSPYKSELVYSIRDGSSFFHGRPPCDVEEIVSLRHKFQETLPEDFLAFLGVHNGFSKHVDTGLITSRELEPLPEGTKSIPLPGSGEVNPQDLIPFYESFNEKKYQCFYAGWTPTGEVGNVFYSAPEHFISDTRNPKLLAENLAFPTFLDWLIFYLEGVEG